MDTSAEFGTLMRNGETNTFSKMRNDISEQVREINNKKDDKKGSKRVIPKTSNNVGTLKKTKSEMQNGKIRNGKFSHNLKRDTSEEKAHTMKFQHDSISTNPILRKRKEPFQKTEKMGSPTILISKTRKIETRGRPRKDTTRKTMQSQNLIKKGFDVCYALDEFIRASRNETSD
jgi:hypothetical protein